MSLHLPAVIPSPPPSAASLFDRLPEISEALAAASHVFLFLDFDGTLAPIVEEPSTARMPNQTLDLVVRLAGRSRFSIALISGRALSDIRHRVGVDGLIYAGDHGFAIEGPGLSFLEPAAARQMPALLHLTNELKSRLSNFPGTLVEYKELTASIHYRQARPGDYEEISRIVLETVAPLSRFFRISYGRKVLEIRPQADWNKGAAVRWILNASNASAALPMYLGDDTTDEDAFRVLPEGVTVRIGPPHGTAARYYLEDQAAVVDFLAWLADLDDRLSRPAPENCELF